MELSDLYIYPVKSLGGVRLTEAKVFQKGFQFDRRWMLVEEDGGFITQRTDHQLALLQITFQEGGFLIYHRSNPDLNIFIPFQGITKNPINISVWGDVVTCNTLDKSFDQWFSNYLGRSCRLVFMTEDVERPIDNRYAKHGEHVSFADGFPYLLIGKNSLKDLNNRLENPVEMNRFRPNLVISGFEAFEEDLWEEIKIGTVHFQVAKPCARCVLTTIDQETGYKGKEPLATLSRYRLKNNKVLFGQNLIALNDGKVAVGDKIEVLSHKKE